MHVLKIYNDNCTCNHERIEDYDSIIAKLFSIGVRFEKWCAHTDITNCQTDIEILETYRDSIHHVKRLYGMLHEDIIIVNEQTQNRLELREHYLQEHTHTDFEIRFFIEGFGIFFLHIDDKVYVIRCEQCDLISIPANIKHWFDMSSNPNFKCIRLFSQNEGWEANYTGDRIADKFRKAEQFRNE